MPIQNVAENEPQTRWSKIVGTLLTERWLIRISALLLLGLFVRSVGFAPVYDDNVLSEWGKLSDIPKFFVNDIFGSDGTAHSVYYRPLALTYGFLFATFTGGAPGWLHLSAILLHITAVLLAYLFGRHLFGDYRLAMLTAILFGLHPSKVESVAWIGSSCVDGLCAVFFFASLTLFLKWRESDSGRWLAGSVALFTGAMFTKETMGFIPILIAAYLWLTLPAEGRIRKTLGTLAPYAVVWVCYMAIRHEVIKPAAQTVEYIHPTFTLTNLWTAPYSIWWYLQHLVMPWGLAVEYAPAVQESPTPYGFALPAAGLFLLAAGTWWLWRLQRSKLAAFLIFWFVLTLAPAVVVAPMVLQHDRYLYICSYAYCALVAWAVLNLGKVQAKARLVVALCLIALWSGLTWHEMGYWDCEQTLWSRVLEISPSHLKAQIQLAFIYKSAGDTPKALSMLDDGLRYRPESLNLWLARANILEDNQQPAEARASYSNVIRLTESARGGQAEAGARARLRAAAAYRLARMDITAKNYSEAEHFARIAVDLNPKGTGFHALLAESLFGEGRVDESKVENALELRLRLARRRN